MHRLKLRAGVTVALAASLVALAVYAGSSTATSSSPRTVKTAKHEWTFAARILQGPSAGKSYSGTLKLTGSSTGYLTGTFASAAFPKPIPVTGQLQGQLIGISLALGSGRTITGTGVVGYDSATRKNTIAGTFSGPGNDSIGVWDTPKTLLIATTKSGGCLSGVLVQQGDGSYACYVVGGGPGFY